MGRFIIWLAKLPHLLPKVLNSPIQSCILRGALIEIELFIIEFREPCHVLPLLTGWIRLVGQSACYSGKRIKEERSGRTGQAEVCLGAIRDALKLD